MKKTITSLFLLTSFVSWSQITIDSADIGTIGDQVVNLYDGSVSGLTVMAPATTAQIFDYTSLSFSSADTINFIDPAGTLGAANFPNSNLVVSTLGGTELAYVIKTQSSAVIDGLYGDPLGAGVVGPIGFNPDVLLAPFPLNMSDSYSSSQIIDTVVEDAFTGIFDSLRLKRVTSISSVIDAYGTLNLPNSSLNVLRQHDVEISSDTVWGKLFGTWQMVQDAAASLDYYRFLAKGKSYYVLELETDQNGSVLSAEFQAGSSLLAGFLFQANVDCYGNSNGSAEVNVIGGSMPYAYAWSTGSTTSMESNLSAGTYTVTVTDGASATFPLNITISQPDSISIATTLIGDNDGTDNGFIDIEVTGGTPSYVYSWSNGETTKNVNNLKHGTYSVTVSDNNGCSNTASFIVGDLTSVFDLESNALISLYPNPSNGNFTIKTNEKWHIKVFSLAGGRILEDQGIGTKEITIPENKKGLFVIQMTVNGQVYQTKLQVQ